MHLFTIVTTKITFILFSPVSDILSPKKPKASSTRKTSSDDNDDEEKATTTCPNPATADYFGAVPPDEPTSWSRAARRELEMSVLEEIQDMEDRVCGASLQVKV